MSQKVNVISNTTGEVSINIPELKFKRSWPRKGAKIPVDKEILEELSYYTGVKSMLDTGILVIEDMDVKKDLGIEPEDATEPVNVIILTDDERKNLLLLANINKFKETVDKLRSEELMNLVDYAVDNEINTSYDKNDYLKERCNRDIILAIQAKRAAATAEEDEKKTK